MESAPPNPEGSKTIVIIGWVFSALPVLLLCFSASMKLMGGPKGVEMMEHLGYQPTILVGLAVLELSCVVIYLFPRTAVTGAILITGYMGGAIASHVRIGETPIVQVIVPIIIWLGLWLREPRLRAILPWRG